MFKTLSCCLNLGNVDIDKSSYVEGATPAKLQKNVYLEKVLEHLKLDYQKLSDGCCVIVRTIGKDVSKSPRSPI